MIENQKALVTIKNKQYELKFTIGFWKEIFDCCGVSRDNLQEKLNDSFAPIAIKIVQLGVKYSLPQDTQLDFSEQDIEYSLDASVLDVIEQAVLNGMTKAEKEMVDLIRKQRQSKIETMVEEMTSADKKKV